MSMTNPFYHRGAIRQAANFHGRRNEIEQILGLLRNGQSVSLIGPRRIGKSSLLIHLCRPEVRLEWGLDPAKTWLILIDCQELGGSPPEDVYETLLTGLHHAAAEAGVTLDPLPNSPGSYRDLDRTLYQISQNHVTVVFLLDEFELLAANEHLTPYFFARLRGLTTKYGLAYLTASQRPLFAITAEEEILSSPFFNIFVTLPLGLYSDEEARTLFLARLKNTDISFGPALNQYLRFLVGPHPFFLHVAGYHAYQALLQNTSLETPEEFTQLDDPIEVEADSHLGYLWQNLTPEEQYVLAIADGSIDTLRLLEQQCLLVNEDGQYVYTSEILRRYVRRQDVRGLIQTGPFVIDQQRHQVWARGAELSLTTSQFNILMRLCQQPGQVVHGDDLETAVWGDVLVDDPDRLKTLIKRLRRAIAPYDNWIISERGVGYALRPPD
ncbi:MAG: winged helix-turn-helix domain-containing protein [Ardenticatenaceae bacterium]|nr:winged helix-turn-helix domain-containing protein [Ardenticatenaceae bacterium]MCB8986796.1 winged helix-turn-helix domain-containing protein [Ardenticatenaceae bacterium]